MNVSLDGLVETPDHSLDWTKVDDELHTWFNDRTREADVSVYGRRLWEVMAAYWPTGERNPDSTEADARVRADLERDAEGRLLA